jgi:hypothetical protein
MRSVINAGHSRRNTLKVTEDFRMHIVSEHTPTSLSILNALQE